MSQLRTNNIANVAGTQSTDVLNVINGSAKAWVNFNGTGTVAISGSYNVSSITDNGTGDYTINFTTAFPNANYATCLTNRNNFPSGWHALAVIHRSVSPTTTSCRVENVGASGGMGDIDIFNGAFFR